MWLGERMLVLSRRGAVLQVCGAAAGAVRVGRVAALAFSSTVLFQVSSCGPA